MVEEIIEVSVRDVGVWSTVCGCNNDGACDSLNFDGCKVWGNPGREELKVQG